MFNNGVNILFENSCVILKDLLPNNWKISSKIMDIIDEIINIHSINNDNVVEESNVMEFDIMEKITNYEKYINKLTL